MRATADDPDLMAALHKLTNAEVADSARAHGIDVPKYVGSRKGLQGQVSRQELFRQMLAKGVKPEDILRAAKPPGPGGLRTFDARDLKVGDTFVDVNGEPRRVVEITEDGRIHTADGTAKTYHGEVNATSELNSPTAQLARGGKFIGEFPEREGAKLPGVPEWMSKYLQPDEVEFLRNRPLLQKNVAAAYKALKPSLEEVVNVAKAGHGLGGWWQRFMDTFAALGEPTAGMENMPLNHVENLKAFHGALSGNKAVEQANKIAWGSYRDWLEAGRPTDLTSINKIVRNNGGISGRNGLDTQKLFKLVNSPQMKEGAAFTGEAFVRSPVEGTSPGAKKIPSMVATTAGKGNLKRVVFDTHMKDLYGMNGLTDAQYIAASVHIRQAGEALGYAAGEAQEQMWGTVLGLKRLLGEGLGPKGAAARFGPDVLANIGKDYAEVILDSMKNDPEVRQIMDDLKKYGFDPGGPVARGKLEQIVEQGRQRMAEPAPRLSRKLLTRTARRIASTRAGP